MKTFERPVIRARFLAVSRPTRLTTAAALVIFLARTIFAAPPQVIVMIGDGMGPGALSVCKYYNDFVLKKSELNIVRLMNDPDAKLSLVLNYSASNLVTDSAAAATAMATGRKTLNGALGVDEKGNPLRSVIDESAALGMMTGLVTTCEVVDATPAGFSVNVSERSDKSEIARKLIDKKVNLIFGGGARYFEQPAGYKVIYEKKSLKNIRTVRDDRIMGLFNTGEMNYRKDRSPTEPTLAEMTSAALDFLGRSGKGFFLMIEGGRIDHAAHDNNIENFIADFLDFDEAVGVVLDYKKKNPAAALVVTADHDTGGVSLTQRAKDYSYPTAEDLKNLKGVYWTSCQHTSTPVILAVLSQTQNIHGGFIDNTAVRDIIMRQLTPASAR